MAKFFLFLNLVVLCFSPLACVTGQKIVPLSQKTVLIGSYTNKDILAHLPKSQEPGQGIYSFSFCSEGKLSFRGVTPAVNPAVLILHPNKKKLYSIKENIDRNGSIDTFNITDGGELIHEGSFDASGKSTCFLTVSPDQTKAIVVNYWDAFIDVVHLDEKGVLKEHLQNFRHQYAVRSRQVLNREDHWENRQVGPHAHSAHFWKDRVFIPDLGENVIFQYRYSPKDLLSQEAVIPLEKGSGPRHMVIHSKLGVAYVSNELKSSVVVAKLDGSEPNKEKARFEPVQYVSTIPENFSEKNYVSEVQMSKDQKFLYVSNRGHDSIAAYEIHQKTGKLKLLEITSTGGEFPRHFAISPEGDYLLVANQDSNEVNVFHRDTQSGRLKESAHSVKVPTPNFVRFL